MFDKDCDVNSLNGLLQTQVGWKCTRAECQENRVHVYCAAILPNYYFNKKVRMQYYNDSTKKTKFQTPREPCDIMIVTIMFMMMC